MKSITYGWPAVLFAFTLFNAGILAYASLCLLSNIPNKLFGTPKLTIDI